MLEEREGGEAGKAVGIHLLGGNGRKGFLVRLASANTIIYPFSKWEIGAVALCLQADPSSAADAAAAHVLKLFSSSPSLPSLAWSTPFPFAFRHPHTLVLRFANELFGE